MVFVATAAALVVVVDDVIGLVAEESTTVNLSLSVSFFLSKHAHFSFSFRYI